MDILVHDSNKIESNQNLFISFQRIIALHNIPLLIPNTVSEFTFLSQSLKYNKRNQPGTLTSKKTVSQ
ncbi:hypothetical protein L2E82_12965 [Cichorium intybus]|uniref:Uncharacterized protein n=1 Tax=Cichorium intybus TaxID=13427 RepID=A0ACB9GJI9_CICIN|nr:hypothetical protein L2E82_12965 [Cichorium intybus]